MENYKLIYAHNQWVLRGWLCNGLATLILDKSKINLEINVDDEVNGSCNGRDTLGVWPPPSGSVLGDEERSIGNPIHLSKIST
jgi:hypothetical protein